MPLLLLQLAFGGEGIFLNKKKKKIKKTKKKKKKKKKNKYYMTPVAIIKGAYRESQEIVLTDLENLENHADKLGMISTVIVGNSSTFRYKDMMINPRGYTSKYNIVSPQANKK